MAEILNRGCIEPPIFRSVGTTIDVDDNMALVSIAISLKRIADELVAANLNGDNLANAIEGAIYRGISKNG